MAEPKDTIVITGGTSGIGLQVALLFAKAGYRIFLLGRNAEAGNTIVQQIQTATGYSDIHFVQADFRSLKEIKGAAEKILRKTDKIHVLVNNAGCITGEHNLTEDGIEQHFAVNYLSHFLLTEWLLPALKNAGKSRIVNITSRAHVTGSINWSDVNLTSSYSPSRAYSQSKLAMVMHAFDLANRLADTDVTALVMYPGLVNTLLGHKQTPLWFSAYWFLARRLGIAASGAAQQVMALAVGEDYTKVSNGYFGKGDKRKAAPVAYDLDAQEKLRILSRSLVAGFMPAY